MYAMNDERKQKYEKRKKKIENRRRKNVLNAENIASQETFLYVLRAPRHYGYAIGHTHSSTCIWKNVYRMESV